VQTDDTGARTVNFIDNESLAVHDARDGYNVEAHFKPVWKLEVARNRRDREARHGKITIAITTFAEYRILSRIFSRQSALLVVRRLIKSPRRSARNKCELIAQAEYRSPKVAR